MSKIEKIKTTCIDCKRDTNHEILASQLYDNYRPNDYRDGKQYLIVKCMGCDHVSFLKIYHDYETIFPIDWEESEYDHVRVYTNFYPDASEVFYKDLVHILPEKLYEIFSETKIAYTQNLSIFTAIGIRAIIECICKDKNITGKDLEKKISNLKSLGDISKRDIELLHSLRFLGNEAAHQLHKPSKKDLKIAMNIVDHLVQTIYIIPEQLKNANFKIFIDNYDKFIEVIKINIENNLKFDFSYSYSLQNLLGANCKVSHEMLKKIEIELISKISKNELPWIEIDQNVRLSGEEKSKNSTENFYKIKNVA